MADAEALRQAMVPLDAPGGGRWTLLGQSYGGFCAVRSGAMLRCKWEHTLTMLCRINNTSGAACWTHGWLCFEPG